MKRKLLLFLIPFVLIISPVMAQDATPTAEPPPVVTPAPDELPPIAPVEDAANALLTTIVQIIAASGLISAPITVFLVSVLKRIDSGGLIPSNYYAVVIAGILMVVLWLARWLGVETQVSGLFNLVGVAGPMILNFILTLLGASAFYNVAKSQNTPILSYQRPASAQNR